MTKWGKILGIASIIFTLMGLGIFAFGLIHTSNNNQVTPDFVLTTVGVVLAVDSGMLGLVVIFFNLRIDDLGKRMDQRFDDLGLSPRQRTK